MHKNQHTQRTSTKTTLIEQLQVNKQQYIKINYSTKQQQQELFLQQELAKIQQNIKLKKEIQASQAQSSIYQPPSNEEQLTNELKDFYNKINMSINAIKLQIRTIHKIQELYNKIENKAIFQTQISKFQTQKKDFLTQYKETIQDINYHAQQQTLTLLLQQTYVQNNKEYQEEIKQQIKSLEESIKQKSQLLQEQ